MMYKDFRLECERLESIGYVVISRNNHTCTATLKKGRRLIKIGGSK